MLSVEGFKEFYILSDIHTLIGTCKGKDHPGTGHEGPEGV
jgi:hypothetical protein